MALLFASATALADEYRLVIDETPVNITGRTADFARRKGEDIDDLTFVTGVRFWF